MPTMKQKSIKPSNDLPYAEAILAYNGSGVDIPAGSLVTLSAGIEGSSLKVALAPAADATTKKQVLFVAKHAIPNGRRGVILPWMVIRNVDTSAVSLPGDPVYLSEAAAGVWAASAAIHIRHVGVALTKDATTGVVLLAPTLMLPAAAM